ncbi:hypothetical protein [Endozoicomonas euniceicola]|uniref:Pyridoxamine 5'-phosphate oxidase putative domain-containing protein n=1 Tax=Endozoicomonas euniceicola TaxID=1234143 RepID=A0ABY6GZ71_9GAMM|nr:hypothetical protein [Endozoicomonas euniceicola]UYM17970.1 hypothetical protein NX720_08720 [Endozoicomonas euniceicola]
MYEGHSTIQELKSNPHANYQKPGTKHSIFLLEKNGEQYYLLPSPMFEARDVAVPRLHDGRLLYAILAMFPQQVMVAPDVYHERYYLDMCVEGHSSITMEQNVFYAGEMSFHRRRLMKWNNSSGHYKPQGQLRYSQLTPNVRRLLPGQSFTDGHVGVY